MYSQPCKFFGSEAGCIWGNNCRYSHNDPNNAPFCPKYEINNPYSCSWGNRCKYRHQQFPLNTIPNQLSTFNKYQQRRPDINNRASEDETNRKMKLICGYIRTLELSFNGITIPESIYHIILSYYFKSFWDRNASHPMIKIEDKMITNLYQHGTASAFSIECVSKGTRIWKIRIIKLTGEIEIGIMENPNIPKANQKFWRLSGGFAYWNGGAINTQSQNEGDVYNYEYSKYGTKYRENDIISVHLNMDLHQLSFAINDYNHGIIPYKLKQNSQYYLGVGLANKGDIVEVIAIE